MSWYAHAGPRTKDSGKFRSRSSHGTVNTAGGKYRNWSYSFVAHQTGSSVTRMSYAVSIRDPNNNRAEYLRGFSSIPQATAGAKQWIDATLGRILPTSPGGQVGTIPQLDGAYEK